MRVLVVGANGLLGSNVVREGQRRGWTVCGTYHSSRPGFDVPLSRFDLGDYDHFDDTLAEHDPDAVLNCAAMTDVDACERNADQAHLLNGEAPGGLASHCAATDVDFVHVSTDYVFDGSARHPYSESADPNPIQAYGASKLAGERSVREEVTAALVARLSFVWGVHRGRDALTGFPAWVRDRLRSGDSVPLFTDQWVTPTRAGQAAATLLDLVERDTSGRYHVACQSCVTPSEFGAVIADSVGRSAELLREGSTSDLDRPASRPSYTCLDVGKVEATLGRSQPTLREDIDAIGDELD
jgi:dTDP-4-dehydrorhamnose reductase